MKYLLILALCICPSWVQAQDRALMKQMAAKYGRVSKKDMKRFSRLRAIKDMYKLGKVRNPLTRFRKTGFGNWKTLTEGDKIIDVDLKNGCRVKGRARGFRFGELHTTKVYELKVVNKKGQELPMITGGKPAVNIKHNDYFNTSYNTIGWNGPESRMMMLLLGHEKGHHRDFNKMSKQEQKVIEYIYDKVVAKKPLSGTEKQILMGFERRAWAQALMDYQEHKKQGFDYLASASTKKRKANGKMAPNMTNILNTIYRMMKGYYELPVEKKSPTDK